jgi:hypothetical protein
LHNRFMRELNRKLSTKNSSPLSIYFIPIMHNSGTILNELIGNISTSFCCLKCPSFCLILNPRCENINPPFLVNFLPFSSPRLPSPLLPSFHSFIVFFCPIHPNSSHPIPIPFSLFILSFSAHCLSNHFWLILVRPLIFLRLAASSFPL